MDAKNISKEVKILLDTVATKDRFALIFSETFEPLVVEHMQELLESYRCTGILIERTGRRMFYHQTPVENVDSIAANGIRPTEDEDATYGAGIVYTYPTLAPFMDIQCPYALFGIDYEGPYLEALYTEDKEAILQGECLLFPQYIISTKLLRTQEAQSKTRFTEVFDRNIEIEKSNVFTEVFDIDIEIDESNTTGEWVLTDPDCMQFRRRLCDLDGLPVFQLTQVCERNDKFMPVCERLYFMDYSKEDLLLAIRSYEDFETFKKHGKDAVGLLAEWLFELDTENELSSLMLNSGHRYESYHEAAAAVCAMVGANPEDYKDFM